MAVVTTENTSCEGPGNTGGIIKSDGIIESWMSEISMNKLLLSFFFLIQWDLFSQRITEQHSRMAPRIWDSNATREHSQKVSCDLRNNSVDNNLIDHLAIVCIRAS